VARLAGADKNGRNEARAGVRQRQPARPESVAVEEKSRERKGIGYVGGACPLLVKAQEIGKPPELVPIRFSRGARPGPAGARRDVDQIVLGAGRRTGRKIEAKTKLGQEDELELRDHRGDRGWILKLVEDSFKRVMEVRMRLALGEKPAQSGKMGHPV